MNVRQLIAKLKKLPPTAIVFKQDHDHDEPNTNGEIELVQLTNKKELIEEIMELHGELSTDIKNGLECKPIQWVTLR